MAEVKNAFIKSKMNQDLDDRLLPSGEYRKGINVQVSRSEGADVGTLQNVRGNKLLIDFSILTGVNNLITIGQFTDTTNNIIYIFLTNYTPPATNLDTYSATASNFVYSYNVLTETTTPLLSGAYLNFSTTNLILGVNVLEGLLFWTDNRNQPRKINISLAAPIAPAVTPTYYTSEDQISVAKINPYECIELYKYDVSSGSYVTAMFDRTSENLPDKTTPNPNYDVNYPGDPDYLEDKYARFSYRFKFDDGEYSLIAPFTQIAYIPKQDGYFLNDNATPSVISTDETSAYRSTVVEFMENKVNNVLLQIPLPSTGNVLFNDYKITEIEILYKESDQTALRVLDVINQTGNAGFQNESTKILEYNYQSRKPYKTLPNSDSIRVYDKIPVKALCQEVISNRIVYSNFQDKHTPPSALNYSVNVSNKFPFDVAPSKQKPLWDTSVREYPMHTLKQNRNYQVGVVLSDKFGRSSSVILSSIKPTTAASGGDTFKGSTYYHPYKTAAQNVPNTWPGDSLKILFEESIPNNKNSITGNPGLYNSDANSASYNPLGWYSYKIVVKQTEQDYYNVYLPGVLNAYPEATATPTEFPTDEINKTANVILLNDNINKVPRDLTEVGPDQKQFRSSVQLFGRVQNQLPINTVGNIQYYPSSFSDTVNTIATANDLNMEFSSLTADGQKNFYQLDTNPLVARISTNAAFGISSTNVVATNMVPALAIYETEAVNSLLDIYWETSTTGLISELNEAINTGTNNPTGIIGYNFAQSEADAIGTIVTGDFAPLDISNVPIISSVISINQITDNTGAQRTGWSITKTLAGNTTPNGAIKPYDSYVLKTTAYFYYGPNAAINESYIFSFNVTDSSTGSNTVLTATGALANAAPVFTNPPSVISAVPGQIDLDTLTGTNGSNVGGSYDNNNLTWSVQPVTSPITITQGGILQDISGKLSGQENITVKLADAGNLTATVPIRVVFGEDPANAAFSGCSVVQGNRDGFSPAISQGYYWVGNTTNASTNTVSGGTNFYPLREPIPELELDDNLADPAKTATVTSVYCTKGSFPAPTITNVDYNTFTDIQPPAAPTQSESNLSSGSAFIGVDFQLNQYNNIISQAASGPPQSINNVIGPDVLFPCFLQYRSQADSASGNSNWVTATDVEGNAIRFGGQQEVNYTDFFDSNTATNGGAYTSNKEGLIRNSSTSNTIISGAVVSDARDAVQVTTQYYGNNGNYGTLTGKANRTFVIGKDQGYETTPDKFGDYRLIIGYPFGRASYYNGNFIGAGVNGEVVTINLKNISPSLNQNVFCPDPNEIFFAKNNSYKITITYGDFYYPTCRSENVYAYEYKISNGQNTVGAAASQVPLNSVFAREWHLKYVTQLFTDSALTTKYTPNSSGGNWYSYTALQNDSQNAASGTWNSYVLEPGGQMNQNTLAADANRRWTAYFDTTGKKQIRTATPNSYDP